MSTTIKELVSQWETSGLNQTAYCKEHNIPYHQFHYWYKIIRDEAWVKDNQKKGKTGFVQVNPKMTTSGSVEVHLANGHKILFHGEVNLPLLKSLLAS